MDAFLLVGIGGGLGSILRFELSRLQPVREIPAGTLLVNITGSFIFGILSFSNPPSDLMSLLGIGCMGGFTTFSTFSYETFRMLENHTYYTMAANILANGAVSILGVYAAHAICSAVTIPW